MAFEKVIKQRGRGESIDHVLVTSNKQFNISTYYMPMFGNAKWLDVYYDPDTQRGLVRAADERSVDSVAAIYMSSKQVRFASLMLNKLLGLKRYPTKIACRWDDELGGLVIGPELPPEEA